MPDVTTDFAAAIRASRWPALALAAVVILVDQWTKDLAVEHLASPSHPLLVVADGASSVEALLASRGVEADQAQDAIRRRMVWRYRQTAPLDAAIHAGEREVPRQLILKAGAGFPSPRRIRILSSDHQRPLGEVLVQRARMDPATSAEVLAAGVLAAESPVLRPNELPDAGEAVAMLDRHIDVVDGFMKLVYAENPGAAWGFMRDASATLRMAFFSVIALLAALAMCWAIWTGWMGTSLGTIALGAVLGGAVGNLIDRGRYQVVVDFVLNYAGDFRWPVYNVADIGITVGVGLILLELLLQRSRRVVPSPGG
jgi:signal peptidase II